MHEGFVIVVVRAGEGGFVITDGKIGLPQVFGEECGNVSFANVRTRPGDQDSFGHQIITAS